jgi:hypothetical protein
MNYVRQQARSFRIFAVLMAPFLLMLSPQSALAQGFKMTQVNAPGAQTGTTFPFALNTSEAVVGNYKAANGDVVGFLYAAGKYTTIKPPGTDGYTRAEGINDSNTITGDFLASDGRYHGYIYSGGAYRTYNETKTESCGIFGVNNAGDFVGNVGNVGEPGRGFINVGGKKTEFYGSGTDTTYAYTINSSDEVVGEYFDSSNLQHGFYRSASGTITEIAYPGATQTSATGINDSGEITGTYINASNIPYGFIYIKGKYATTDFASTAGINSKGAYVGYYWGVPDGTPSGYLASPQAFTLSTVKVPGNLQAQLWGINKAGVSVGSYVASNGTSHGMMISGGKVKDIDDPEGTNTICFGINATNEIVGLYTNSSGNAEGFEYTAGKFKDVPGPAGAVSSAAFGINDAENISGLYSLSSGNTYGFVLTSGKYKTLNVSGSEFTLARGINNAGLVTLQWGDSAGYLQSSLYNGKTYTPINVPGAAVNQVQGINSAGDIVYYVSDPYGVGHGAVKIGKDYYIFDYPKGSNTGAGGINDSNLIVGSYDPAGKSVPQAFQGTE